MQSLSMQYEIGITNSYTILSRVIGTDLSATFFADCEKILTHYDDITSANLEKSHDNMHKYTKPDEIHVLSGPGSFISTRFIVLAAKTLSLLWKIPLKSATVMDCIKIHYPSQQNLQIILTTGTSYYYTWQYNNVSLKLVNEIDFSQPWTTNLDLPQNSTFLPFPDILNLLPKTCMHKKEEIDLQPIYSIKPVYLQTETEISQEQKDDFQQQLKLTTKELNIHG